MVPQPKKVCVIGAGVSGVVTAVHLKAVGLEVTVFERYSVAGGVWVFDERQPPEPPYPSTKASEADFTAVMSQAEWISKQKKLGFQNQEKVDAEVWLAPPGSCYDQLTNNVPTSLMELQINSWKPNTGQNVNNRILGEYIQDTAAKYNIPESTFYNTRVEQVFKIGDLWRVQTRSLADPAAPKKIKSWDFDFVVAATGHYHACRVPDIPGLKEWKTAWPGRVKHSKGYRRPLEYKNQTVLLVGASVSSTDIAREMGPHVKKIYQVSRGGLFDLPSNWLPENAVRIGEIASFNDESGSLRGSSASKPRLQDGEPIPNSVTLVNGEIIHGIDSVLLCTGYLMSYPFLRQYHQDSVAAKDADDEVIITDGSQMHNLHKDIFYIPDPTLTFIGVPYYTATFSLFEYQAITLAAVLSGKARLPELAEMKEEYQQRLAKKGPGKPFHSLKSEEVEYVDSLVEWINKDGKLKGKDAVQGHSPEWKAMKQDLLNRMKMRFEIGRQ